MKRALFAAVAVAVALASTFAIDARADDDDPAVRLELIYDLYVAVPPNAPTTRLSSIYPFATPEHTLQGTSRTLGFGVGDGANLVLRHGIVLPLFNVDNGFSPFTTHRDLGSGTTLTATSLYWMRVSFFGLGVRTTVHDWDVSLIERPAVSFGALLGSVEGPRGRYDAKGWWTSFTEELELELCDKSGSRDQESGCFVALPSFSVKPFSMGAFMGLRMKLDPFTHR